MVVANISGVRAQTADPGLRVNLVTSQFQYLFNDPNDPIEIELTLENVSGAPIITPKGFGESPFHLFLVFTDPDGNEIIANDLGQIPDAQLPRVLPVGGQLLQVEPVEILATDLVLPVNIPDVRAFYTLDKPGDYLVTAKVVFRIYPAVDFTVGGDDFARLDSFDSAGRRNSNTGRFSLIADADGDGFSFPLPDSRISPFTIPDCDDANASVNPGATEIPGDGIDNDCNPTTLDLSGSFDEFTIEKAKVDLKPDKDKGKKGKKGKGSRDRFEVKGRFVLGTGDSVDVLNEVVTVTFGGFRQTLPARAFVRKGRTFRFRGAPGGLTRIDIRDDGRFSVKAKDLNLTGLVDLTSPVPFSLQIGNDLGSALIPFDRKGNFKSKKKSKKKKKK